jgi:hypothetical protein
LNARVFLAGSAFQPSQMFASKAGAYLAETLSGAPSWDRLLALPTNIRLGLKGLPDRKILKGTLASFKQVLHLSVDTGHTHKH